MVIKLERFGQQIRGKSKYSEKNCPSTINSTKTGLELNLGLYGGKLANKLISLPWSLNLVNPEIKTCVRFNQSVNAISKQISQYNSRINKD
jgi:hypothetical protein